MGYVQGDEVHVAILKKKTAGQIRGTNTQPKYIWIGGRSPQRVPKTCEWCVLALMRHYQRYKLSHF